MLVYTREKLLRLLKIDFIRFCIVGGTGFVINFIILVGLQHLFGVGVTISQFIAAEVALFCNFMLHHHWTYRDNKVHKSIKKLLLQFHATSWPAILGSTIMVTIAEKHFHFNDLLALSTASAISLLWNFSWSKYVIWRDTSSKNVEELVK